MKRSTTVTQNIKFEHFNNPKFITLSINTYKKQCINECKNI